MQSMEKLLYLYCKILKLKRICSGLTLMHVCGYVIRVTHVYSDRLSQHIHCTYADFLRLPLPGLVLEVIHL